MDDPGTTSSTHDGVTHLQKAAHEMIAAARSFLDVCEEVVSDDQRLAGMVDGVTDALKGAADAVSDAAHEAGSAGSAATERVREHIVVE